MDPPVPVLLFLPLPTLVGADEVVGLDEIVGLLDGALLPLLCLNLLEALLDLF